MIALRKASYAGVGFFTETKWNWDAIEGAYFLSQASEGHVFTRHDIETRLKSKILCPKELSRWEE